MNNNQVKNVTDSSLFSLGLYSLRQLSLCGLLDVKVQRLNLGIEIAIALLELFAHVGCGKEERKRKRKER